MTGSSFFYLMWNQLEITSYYPMYYNKVYFGCMAHNSITDKTDEEVAGIVQNGNSEAFGILVDRYEGKMLRYGRKFLYSYADVEDAVQNVFIKAYTNIQSFNITRKFSSWLYRIAHNTFINVIKKKKREPLYFFEPDTLLFHAVKDDRTQEELARKDSRELLERCLDKLDPKYREPLVLYYFEEKDYKEIADIMRIPVSTVGIRLKRGKQGMKKLLADKKI